MGSWERSVDRRFGNIITRGSLTKAIDDSGPVQSAEVTGLPGSDFGATYRAQSYGFTSRPGSGAEVVLIAEDGLRENCIVISADHPSMRPKIKEYESCVWTKFGTHVWLKDDKSLDVKADKVKMVVKVQTLFESPKFGVKGPQGELIDAIYQSLLAIQQFATATAAGGGAPFPQSGWGTLAGKISPLIAKIQPFIVSP